MSELIKNALKALDVTNDNHWMSDNQPRIETVRFLTGDAKLTREQIRAACPLFSRENPVVDVVQKGEAPIVDTVVVVATPGDEIVAKVAENLEVSDLDKAIIDLQKHLDKARKDKDIAIAVYNRLTEQMDLLITERDKEIPASSSTTQYQDYLASQQKIREQRAEVLGQIKDTGITEVLKNLQSPVDTALKTRKRQSAK